jgi:hypothetical protein
MSPPACRAQWASLVCDGGTGYAAQRRTGHGNRVGYPQMNDVTGEGPRADHDKTSDLKTERHAPEHRPASRLVDRLHHWGESDRRVTADQGIRPGGRSLLICHGAQHTQLAWHASYGGQPLDVVDGQGLTAARGQRGVVLEVGCQWEYVHCAAGLPRCPRLEAPEEYYLIRIIMLWWEDADRGRSTLDRSGRCGPPTSLLSFDIGCVFRSRRHSRHLLACFWINPGA